MNRKQYDYLILKQCSFNPEEDNVNENKSTREPKWLGEVAAGGERKINNDDERGWGPSQFIDCFLALSPHMSSTHSPHELAIFVLSFELTFLSLSFLIFLQGGDGILHQTTIAQIAT